MSERHSRITASCVALLWVVTFARVAAFPAGAQTIWPPTLTEDAAMTDCPQQPGAPAVILYREELTDVESRTTSVFKRLKILTPAGRDRSNIEIQFIEGYSKITGIEARVVPAQGPERKFDGQVFDKTIVRYGKLRLAVIAFALPDVEVGSIIDYRYKVEFGRSSSSAKAARRDPAAASQGSGPARRGRRQGSKDWRSSPGHPWRVQEDLFTRRRSVLIRIHLLPYIALIFDGPCRMAGSPRDQGTPRAGIKGSRLELEMENIPAFKEEEFMTSPRTAEQMSVDVFYLAPASRTATSSGSGRAQIWQKTAERFIGEPGQGRRQSPGDHRGRRGARRSS